MCRTTASCVAPLIALALAVPALADTAPSAAPPAPAAAALPAALDGGACAVVPGKVVDYDSGAAPAFGTPEPQPMIGCTAEYNCVHGTTVSCSSPVNGTCQASGAGCGAVFCNGQATWCPGRCIGDHHCAGFCDWDPEAFCDEFGCCDCDG